MQTTAFKATKQPLARKNICETALTIIDRDGLDAVNMRGLAAALGVKAGSLYYHVKNKEDLLEGVAELLYKTLGPLPVEIDWECQVCAIFLQMAEVAEEHPNAAPLLIDNFGKSTTAQQRASALAAAVGRSGLDEKTCARLINNIVFLLAGYSLGNPPADAALGVKTVRPTVWLSSQDGWEPDLALDSEFETGMKALIKGFRG